MTDIASSLEDFGADPASLLLLDADGPELLPYATLLVARRGGDEVLSLVNAVYEWQGAPLLFLINADSLEGQGQLHRIRRLLAMRGDAPYMGVVSPGRLEVYRIELDKRSLSQARIELGTEVDGRRTTLARLGNLRPHAAISQRGWISNIVLNLLTRSITRLIELDGLSDQDAISLVGRALFVRFLADRGLLPANMAGATAARLFDHRVAAKRTSKWLDSTFNGDLLPLSVRIFDALSPEAYSVLGDVLRRAPDSQLFLGWEEKWDSLDFAHIPVGVLSQAYELFLRNHSPDRQKREGGYYTPRLIADLMVRASFRALERCGVSSRAKVLDPAAGAGVFLISAFRELVAARWRADGKRPVTRILRSILDRQITGFDVNEAALRFAALGLYLMSIELDPSPRPVDKLSFDDLRAPSGQVLHKLEATKGTAGWKLGSLGPLVGQQHVGKYDLIIGNPPWASGTKLPDWQLVRQIVARIATSRLNRSSSPPLPNEGLDLPFVWRAMEWAKPGGQIAFALHARLLFQQGDGMTEARLALFEALDVTAIINGVELRQTKVWPEIDAPFCILIATNNIPGAGGSFRFISPRLEQGLNESGSMRIDALNAELVRAAQLVATPDLLKILFRGTRADLGIIERIRAHGHPTLQAYWRRSIGEIEQGKLKGSGNGYQLLRRSSRIRKNGDGLPGVDASYLRKLRLPDITAESFTSPFIQPDGLKVFARERIHDPRSTELFAGPLVLVHKSPPAATSRIGIAVADAGVIFNETFYGYSAASHPHSAVLVRYLAFIFGSKLATWMALVTSGEFGFEREVIEKTTLDRIPIPDFDAIPLERHGEIVRLFEMLCADRITWTEIDEWVAHLYGLGSRDLQVIADTLEFNLPFSANKNKAQSPPGAAERAEFRDVLTHELSAWCERFGRRPAVRDIEQLVNSPWCGIEVRFGNTLPAQTIAASDWAGLLLAADEVAASEILHPTDDTLLIGRLAQQRYWSPTQARLLAQRIIWSHLGRLEAMSRT